jgi:hypothetical protein
MYLYTPLQTAAVKLQQQIQFLEGAGSEWQGSILSLVDGASICMPTLMNLAEPRSSRQRPDRSEGHGDRGGGHLHHTANHTDLTIL